MRREGESERVVEDSEQCRAGRSQLSSVLSKYAQAALTLQKVKWRERAVGKPSGSKARLGKGSGGSR